MQSDISLDEISPSTRCVVNNEIISLSSALSSTSDEEDEEESGYFDDVFSMVKSHCQIERLEDLNWYHSNMTRHTSEALLLANGVEGSYLLRNSQDQPGSYAVSVRCQDSIKHFSLEMIGCKGSYTFGIGSFDTLKELLDHFECMPVLGTGSGSSVTLKHAYLNDIPEPCTYEKVVRHSEQGKTYTLTPQQRDLPPDFHIASKEGYLIKRGAIHKNWKKRWFLLQKNHLQYFKDNNKNREVIRTVNLEDAVLVAEVFMDKKDHCFRLELPYRNFYFVASSHEERNSWMDILQWKIDYYKKRKEEAGNMISATLKTVHSVSEYASHIGEKTSY